MSMYHLDGAPMTSDPRHALARQVAVLADKGLIPAGAFELEFFLLANERDADGRVQPARAVLDGRKSGKTEVYSVDHLHGMEPLFSDIYASAAAQGIPAETVISEYAPGQYELTLNYRKDVLRAADDLVMLKRLVRAAARRHGVTACFMAKPIEKYAGSGMHFHVSLPDAAGRNVFAEAGRRSWSPTLLHALGGLVAHHGGIDAGLCPARQFLAPLRVAILCAGRPDLGRQQPLGRAAHPGGRRKKPPHRAPAVRRRRQSLSGRRDGAGRHRQGPRRRARPGPGNHGQWLREPAGGERRHAGRLARRDRGRQGFGLSQGRRSATTCTRPSPRSSRPNICASRAP